MYMDEFKNGANTLNVGTSAEDLLLELDASCEPAVEVYLNVIYAILSFPLKLGLYALERMTQIIQNSSENAMV